jgi:SAM-dependent methyltransferase
VSPGRVLEVGGGEGELAERIVHETGAALVGIEQSERMAELQQARGLDVRVGDLVALPFEAGAFDVAVAAWMLYHAPDLDRAVAELARVLRPGGRLVATTNATDHLRELWDLAGSRPPMKRFSFRSENGERVLRRHFAHVERREARGSVTWDDETIRRYATSWDGLTPLLDLLPLDQPVRASCHSTVFVAETAA